MSEKRRHVVTNLYLLSFSSEEIAEMTRLDVRIIEKDLEYFKEEIGSFERATEDKRMSAVLTRYSELLRSKDCATLQRADELLYGILTNWLRVDHIQTVLSGMVRILAKLQKPQYLPVFAGHVRLIEAVLQKHYTHVLSSANIGAIAWRIWREFLNTISVEADSSHETLIEQLTDYCLQTERNNILPYWSSELFEIVDKQLEALTTNEYHVVLMKHGIYQGKQVGPRSTEEIVSELSISEEEMSGLYKSALTKLRASPLTEYLKACVQPADYMFQVYARGLETKASTDTRLFQTLTCLVDTLHLPTGTINALKNEEILLIGDLVQRSDVSILKIPEIGKKRWQDIQDELARLKVSLGMKLDDAMLTLLEEYGVKRFTPAS